MLHNIPPLYYSSKRTDYDIGPLQEHYHTINWSLLDSSYYHILSDIYKDTQSQVFLIDFPKPTGILILELEPVEVLKDEIVRA